MVSCKYCHSNTVFKFGTYKGVQRYFCKQCWRKFKADDTAFHMKAPAEYVASALDMYYQSLLIRFIRTYLKESHGYYPAKSVVYQWIKKYSAIAKQSADALSPTVGDLWLLSGSMLELDGQNQVWIYDIMDRKTRFLLGTRMVNKPDIKDIEILVAQAEQYAGKLPEVIVIDKEHLPSSDLKAVTGIGTTVRMRPFRSSDNPEIIERFKGTLKNNQRIIRPFKYVATLANFIEGWKVHYNYFQPNKLLKGKTPAEESGIHYTAKNWAELVRTGRL